MELQQLNKVVFIDKETVITADFLNQLQAVIEAHHEAIIVSTEAVEGKAERIHIHQIADIEGLEAQLATLATIEEVANIRKVLEGYAQKEHRHNVSEIDGLAELLPTEELEGIKALIEQNKQAIAQKAELEHVHATTDIADLAEQLAQFLTEESLLETLGGYVATGDLESVKSTLEGAIAQKAEMVHTHNVAEIDGLEARLEEYVTSDELSDFLTAEDLTGLQNDVSSVKGQIETKADKTHQHDASEINGLDAKLEGFVSLEDLNDFLTADDLTELEQGIEDVKGKIDAKADKSHNHALADVDGLSTALSEFVTNSALVEQLSAKADKDHTHSILNVAGLTEALAERYTKSEVDGLLTDIEVDLSPVETKIEEVAGDVATLKETSASQSQKLVALESDVEELTAIVTDLTIVEIDDSQETAGTVWSSAKTKQEIENAVQSVDVTIENATPEVAGLMSAEDKKKLDGINSAEITEIKEDVELLREASATQAQSLETVKTTAESAKTVANDVKAKVEDMSAKLDKIDETAPRIYAQSTAPVNAVVGTIWIKIN